MLARRALHHRVGVLPSWDGHCLQWEVDICKINTFQYRTYFPYLPEVCASIALVYAPDRAQRVKEPAASSRVIIAAREAHACVPGAREAARDLTEL